MFSVYIHQCVVLIHDITYSSVCLMTEYSHDMSSLFPICMFMNVYACILYNMFNIIPHIMLIYMTLYINMYMSECVCVCVCVSTHHT